MPLTDEEAALLAITALTTLTTAQQDAKAKIDSILASDDPFFDVHELLNLYDILYFRSLLSARVEPSWSPRLTLCAGICELIHGKGASGDSNGGNRIRLKLSEPLLKYRPRSDAIDTLLHEAIHAYFFVTTSWRHARGDDGTGHGTGFLLLADAINDHGRYGISVFHTFHDEVDRYRTHVWRCDGPCQNQGPFFGLVKRSMNRAPGKHDGWWPQHVADCGGRFVKIAEPDLSPAQVEKLSGLKRAGRQKTKIDAWVSRTVPNTNSESSSASDSGMRPSTQAIATPSQNVACPICENQVNTSEINQHLDHVHGLSS